MTHFLRFPDESVFASAAFVAGLYNEPNADGPGGYLQYSDDHAMDIVGVIYSNNAVVDLSTDKVTTPATALDGWHVNFVGELPVGWDEFLVNPVAPYRVFA